MRPRKKAPQNGSQRRRPARLEVCISTAPESIETTGRDIFFELTVPKVRLVFLKPPGELGEIVAVELGNGGFEFVDAHDDSRALNDGNWLRRFTTRLWDAVF